MEREANHAIWRWLAGEASSEQYANSKDEAVDIGLLTPTEITSISNLSSPGPYFSSIPSSSIPTLQDTSKGADMGLSIFHLVETFDVVLSLDYLQFSAIRRNLFENDFKNDGKKYSSSNLVRSVCSLATVLAGRAIDSICTQVSIKPS